LVKMRNLKRAVEDCWLYGQSLPGAKPKPGELDMSATLARAPLLRGILLGAGFVAGMAGALLAQAPDRLPRAAVELRWVEAKPIARVTESEGYQTSCDPDSVMYLHLMPTLTLTSAEVLRVELKEIDLSGSGRGRTNFMVAFQLTKEAREKLAAMTEGKKGTQYFTVIVDGKPWGLQRNEPDPETPFVPAQCRAATLFAGGGECSRLGSRRSGWSRRFARSKTV
jgi:hypothetical protein